MLNLIPADYAWIRFLYAESFTCYLLIMTIEIIHYGALKRCEGIAAAPINPARRLARKSDARNITSM